MKQLLDLFLFCGGFGFLWIAGSAVLGFMGSGSDDTGADSGGGDSGDLGGADAGDSGDLGGVDADGASDGGDFGGVEANTVNSFRTGLVIQKKRLSPTMLILKMLSPSTITTFMFFFGLAGYLSLHTWPILGWLSLVPAIVFGVMGYKAFSAFSGMLIKKMQVSTGHTEEQIIGCEADVTVPIDTGRMGEITYVANGIRHTAPARASNAAAAYPKGTRVIVTNTTDGVFSVENT